MLFLQLDPVNVQQLIDQLQKASAVILYGRYFSAIVGGQRRCFQQFFHRIQNQHQRRAYFMTDVGKILHFHVVYLLNLLPFELFQTNTVFQLRSSQHIGHNRPNSRKT